MLILIISSYSRLIKFYTRSSFNEFLELITFTNVQISVVVSFTQKKYSVYIFNAVNMRKNSNMKKKRTRKKKSHLYEQITDTMRAWRCLPFPSFIHGFLRCSNEYKETGQKKISPSDIWFMLIIYFFFFFPLLLFFSSSFVLAYVG